jgi:hypothetical protein
MSICHRSGQILKQQMYVCMYMRRATTLTGGHGVAQLVEALRYKPEGRRFIPDGVIGIFHCHNPSGRTMALELIQPRTEMSTRDISWRVKGAGAYS